MKVSRSNITVSFAALACAGVIGGVTAISLVGQQQPSRDTIVRSVSDEGGAVATPSAQASATTMPSASAAAAVPTVAATAGPAQTSSTTTRSQTVTEPNPTTEPAPAEPAPIAPPANSAPDGAATPPSDNAVPPPGPTFECLPQEYGVNPRCPLPAPAN